MADRLLCGPATVDPRSRAMAAVVRHETLHLIVITV